jgi:3',5'-cyclic AMP phosphodiesterase CpdA
MWACGGEPPSSPFLDAGVASDGGGVDHPLLEAGAASGFTLAVLPDTQMYVEQYPHIFEAQTRWLREQSDTRDLRLVMHEGDLVNYADNRAQWEVASDMMGILDGHLPYVIAPGNHDYGITPETENSGDRSTFLHEYFPRERFEAMPTFGGFFDEEERVDNSYHLFTAGEDDWLVLALEFGPRDAVVEWANEVLSQHADHFAILLTHAYLYRDGERYDRARFDSEQDWNPHEYGVASLEGGVNDGQELWQKLVSRHGNVIAVLCGHVHSPGIARATRDTQGGTVEEILTNFQGQPDGGGGYLRLLRFDSQRKRVEVETYSPWLDAYLTDPANRFSFEY